MLALSWHFPNKCTTNDHTYPQTKGNRKKGENTNSIIKIEWNGKNEMKNRLSKRNLILLNIFNDIQIGTDTWNEIYRFKDPESISIYIFKKKKKWCWQFNGLHKWHIVEYQTKRLNWNEWNIRNFVVVVECWVESLKLKKISLLKFKSIFNVIYNKSYRTTCGIQFFLELEHLLTLAQRKLIFILLFETSSATKTN